MSNHMGKKIWQQFCSKIILNDAVTKFVGPRDRRNNEHLDKTGNPGSKRKMR